MAESGKKLKDYSEEAKTAISLAWDASKGSGKWKDEVEKLMLLEKQTRNASDAPSTTLLVQAILNIAYENEDYAFVLESLTVLSKKHGQFKTAVTATVDLVMGWLDNIKSREGIKVWLEWVAAVRSVTEGKIFLETPRARVTLALALYHESIAHNPSTDSPPPAESLQTASDLLQELQVETYSSMELREKIEILLEQMRLLMLVARIKDGQAAAAGGLADGEAEWVKMRVGSRKINETFINKVENKDLKLKYHELMIQHSLRQSLYLEVAKSYHKIWEMPSIQGDEALARKALEHVIYYVVLAPYDNEQSDMLHRLFADPLVKKQSREMQDQSTLAKRFITEELMRWSGFEEYFGNALLSSDVFTGPDGKKRYKDLHTRVTEHNIRVISKYYSRISLKRLTELLVLSLDETEEILSRLVVGGMVWARIDRPAGIVLFRQKRSAEDVMNDWSSDMGRLLGLVDKAWMLSNAEVAAKSVSNSK